MSDSSASEPPKPATKVAPETLELRARPQPVTRINPRLLMGAAAGGLIGIASIVLLALRPPSFRSDVAQELYAVDHKPITDGLAKLPTSYEDIRPPASDHRDAQSLPTGVPPLQSVSLDPTVEAERVEKERLARMEGQAREAPVFFRLQPKNPTRDLAPAHSPSDDSMPTGMPEGGGLTGRGVQLAPDRAAVFDATGPDAQLADAAADPQRKLAFLKSTPAAGVTNPHRLQTPASPYQLMAGTIIAASLVTGLNSDLPGFVIAQVTENVFDSVSGRFLLIPQGARLVGTYDNVVSFGQERALIVWQRLILPDGSSIGIDNLPATDSGGYAGIAGEVDTHTRKLMEGVLLSTVLSVGSTLAFGATGGESDIVRALRESTGQTTNRAGQRLVEKDLNVQPTLTVRPGWPLRVIVHKDIVLRPYRLATPN